MAAVLQFRRKTAPAGWVNEELAEFYRIVDVMGRAGLAISVDVGVSDEGEPWVAFVREDSGDVLAHIARIDGWVVAVSAASPEIVRAQSLKEVVRRIVDTHPLVLLPTHRPGAHIHVHPCAVLAAFITAAYLLAEGIQSEANAREYAVTLAADAAAVVTAAHKAAPHPNPLRSALTSISDFVRGVGDLVQPVTVNAASASAAIAAVVAFVFAGDDNGTAAAQRAELAQARADGEMAAQALAQLTDQGAKNAEAVAASSAHSVGLDRTGGDAELQTAASTPLAHRIVDADAASAAIMAVDAHERVAAIGAATAPETHVASAPVDSGERVHLDAAIAMRLAAVEAGEHSAKLQAAETISSAVSTVASAVNAPAVKAEASAAVSAANTLANAAAPSRATAGSDAVVDHGAASPHATPPTNSADYLVVRLSDLSKVAVAALRLTDTSFHLTAIETASTSTTAATTITASANSQLSLSTTATALAVESVDLSSPSKTLASTLSSSADVVAAPVASSSATVVAPSAPVTESVTDSLLRTSAPGTVAAAPVETAQPSVGPTAHQIISSIVEFALGADRLLSASSASREAIQTDLTAHGITGSGQKVLVFYSDSIKAPAFEFTPGIVMVTRQEVISASGEPGMLPPPAGGVIIDLADGAAIRLIGVIDLSATV